MREIKFRAFIKEEEFMLYENDRETDYFMLSEGNEFGVVYDENWLNKNEYIIMQYTGLKDKNGKEIYEGDIIVQDGYIWFDDGVPNYRGVVEWIYSQWQVILHCVNSEKQGISDGINESINEGFDDGECTCWEVVGNIYENPELLTR